MYDHLSFTQCLLFALMNKVLYSIGNSEKVSGMEMKSHGIEWLPATVGGLEFRVCLNIW